VQPSNESQRTAPPKESATGRTVHAGKRRQLRHNALFLVS
jgi:hypothetical protein